MRKWVISAYDLRWIFENISEEGINNMLIAEIEEVLESILEEESEVCDCEGDLYC